MRYERLVLKGKVGVLNVVVNSPNVRLFALRVVPILR